VKKLFLLISLPLLKTYQGSNNNGKEIVNEDNNNINIIKFHNSDDDDFKSLNGYEDDKIIEDQDRNSDYQSCNPHNSDEIEIVEVNHLQKSIDKSIKQNKLKTQSKEEELDPIIDFPKEKTDLVPQKLLRSNNEKNKLKTQSKEEELDPIMDFSKEKTNLVPQKLLRSDHEENFSSKSFFSRVINKVPLLRDFWGVNQDQSPQVQIQESIPNKNFSEEKIDQDKTRSIQDNSELFSNELTLRHGTFLNNKYFLNHEKNANSSSTMKAVELKSQNQLTNDDIMVTKVIPDDYQNSSEDDSSEMNHVTKVIPNDYQNSSEDDSSEMNQVIKVIPDDSTHIQQIKNQISSMGKFFKSGLKTIGFNKEGMGTAVTALQNGLNVVTNQVCSTASDLMKDPKEFAQNAVKKVKDLANDTVKKTVKKAENFANQKIKDLFKAKFDFNNPSEKAIYDSLISDVSIESFLKAKENLVVFIKQKIKDRLTMDDPIFKEIVKDNEDLKVIIEIFFQVTHRILDSKETINHESVLLILRDILIKKTDPNIKAPFYKPIISKIGKFLLKKSIYYYAENNCTEEGKKFVKHGINLYYKAKHKQNLRLGKVSSKKKNIINNNFLLPLISFPIFFVIFRIISNYISEGKSRKKHEKNMEDFKQNQKVKNINSFDTNIEHIDNNIFS
jgi:hypothetical protein